MSITKQHLAKLGFKRCGKEMQRKIGSMVLITRGGTLFLTTEAKNYDRKGPRYASEARLQGLWKRSVAKIKISDLTYKEIIDTINKAIANQINKELKRVALESGLINRKVSDERASTS